MNKGQFDYFVIFAEMRTGSNFLESNLNALKGVSCLGEAFNPAFLGTPDTVNILGLTQMQRDADPHTLLDAMQSQRGELCGFRFFHDHDARILDRILDDPRCAKVILRRNPLDSYISWKIARETGQWKLTSAKGRKVARPQFDNAEFARFSEQIQSFQALLKTRLQTSGQVPFMINYPDLQDLRIINGLAKWLGATEPLEALDKTLKRQNPGSAFDKVSNPDEMKQSLSGMGATALISSDTGEPRRNASVKNYVATPTKGLLYLPIEGGPVADVCHWLAQLEGDSVDDLLTGMNQKQLRKWMRTHPEQRSFSVVRHPVARAYDVFCTRIVNTGPGAFPVIRETLQKRHDVILPDDMSDSSYSLADHRVAFGAFLTFLRANLAGQTTVRIDGGWASQVQVLAGFADVLVPDHILREDTLSTALPQLAGEVDLPCQTQVSDTPYALADIYDEDIEKATIEVYRRDYLRFGFQNWSG